MGKRLRKKGNESRIGCRKSEEGRRVGMSEHGRMKIQCFVFRCVRSVKGDVCPRGGANSDLHGHILLKSRRLYHSI